MQKGMERAFKGVWIPKEIWLDESLGWSEKLLLVEIHSLDNESGCWAGNEYFSEFFSLSKDRISKLISSLKKKGYITVDLVYQEGTRKIEKRVVKITDRYRQKQLDPIGENNYTPIGENAEDNNTLINNTSNKEKYIQYAESVKMKESEYGKLVEAHGEILAKKMIEVLDNYKGASGKRYKSDYKAIQVWVREKVLKEQGGKPHASDQYANLF